LPPTFPPTSSTALRTASTFECLLAEPLLELGLRERDLLFAFEALAPLLELRDLPVADFALAFEAFGLAFDAFDLGFEDDFALFGADRLFALVFVWAIVPLLADFPGLVPDWS